VYHGTVVVVGLKHAARTTSISKMSKFSSSKNVARRVVILIVVHAVVVELSIYRVVASEETTM
jgi:hypothetical protein